MLKKHVVWMLICCLFPLVGLGVIVLFNILISSVLWFVLILLCPISHLFMMKYIGDDESHSQHSHSAIPSELPEAQNIEK